MSILTKINKDQKYPYSVWRQDSEYCPFTSYRFTVLDFNKVESPMQDLSNRKFRI